MQIKILYVEDELALGKIVKHALTASGYDVFLESDGAKVVMAFNKFNPHICVLDVMLPNVSGFDLAKQIKEINKEMPIIFVTAKTQTTDVVEGFKLGANDYLKKPFSIEELIARVENLLTIKKISTTKKIPICSFSPIFFAVEIFFIVNKFSILAISSSMLNGFFK